MKKNIIAVVLLLLLSAVFCFGCTPTEPETPSEPEPPAAEVTPVKLEAKGGKAQFEWGEAFSSEGLTVTVTYSDSTTKTLTASEYKVSSVLYNAEREGDYNIQVTHKNLKTKYTVHVGPRPENLPRDWKEDGVLRILMIGNSYSDDAIEYVGSIAQSLNVQISLGNLYIGNCSLIQHLTNLKNNAANYEYRTFSADTNFAWKNTKNYSANAAIELEDWDFISLQQNSTETGHPDSYSTLDELIPLVRQHNSTATLVWHMPWADAFDSQYSVFATYGKDMIGMYNAYVSATKDRILTRPEFSAVLPTGTAIQNARTSFLGVKGDILNRDGHHLSYSIGRYIASLTVFAKLSGVDISGLTWAPAGVTEAQKRVALESAMNAISSPYAITQSKITSES